MATFILASGSALAVGRQSPSPELRGSILLKWGTDFVGNPVRLVIGAAGSCSGRATVRGEMQASHCALELREEAGSLWCEHGEAVLSSLPLNRANAAQELRSHFGEVLNPLKNLFFVVSEAGLVTRRVSIVNKLNDVVADSKGSVARIGIDDCVK
jgi:hypothetical protein